MGACGSGEKVSAEEAKQRKLEKDRSKSIDGATKKQEQEDKKIKKLLLLGAGESGKSTLFKQMITLYGKGFSKEDKVGYIPIIYNNTITSMKTLVKQSDILDDENCRIRPEHAESKAFVNDLKVNAVPVLHCSGINADEHIFLRSGRSCGGFHEFSFPCVVFLPHAVTLGLKRLATVRPSALIGEFACTLAALPLRASLWAPVHVSSTILPPHCYICQPQHQPVVSSHSFMFPLCPPLYKRTVLSLSDHSCHLFHPYHCIHTLRAMPRSMLRLPSTSRHCGLTLVSRPHSSSVRATSSTTQHRFVALSASRNANTLQFRTITLSGVNLNCCAWPEH